MSYRSTLDFLLDEWIGIDELAEADRMMERLAAKLSRPAEEWIKT